MKRISEMRFVLFILFFLICSEESLAQKKILGKPEKSVFGEINASTSGNSPFWIRSGQNGEVLVPSNYLAIGMEVKKAYDSVYTKNRELNKLDWGYGFNGFINSRKNFERIVVPEAYVKGRFKSFELFMGRKKEIVGLTDSTLSSGSLSISGNAIPIPQIKFHIPNFIPLFKSKYVSFKGSYSHGWFGKQTYLKNVFYHHKSLYLRVGKPSWRIQMTAGFNHQIQWGGELNSLEYLSSIRNGKVPSSFKDYIYAISGVSLGTDKIQSTIEIDQYTGYDLTNRIGNHLGTIDLNLDLFLENAKLSVYRQSLYDDGSLFYLINISDGLLGISVENRKMSVFRKFVVEYFNSMNQGGPISHSQTQNPYVRGWDDYYNHGQFLEGWAYQQSTLGTPFINPQNSVLEKYQIYVNPNSANIPVAYFTSSNRVSAIFLGSKFQRNNTSLTLRYSIAQHLGTYKHPFSSKIIQNSFALNLEQKINPNTMIEVEYGHDEEGLLIKTHGLRVKYLMTL